MLSVDSEQHKQRCQHQKVLGRQASFENFALVALKKLEWDHLGNSRVSPAHLQRTGFPVKTQNG